MTVIDSRRAVVAAACLASVALGLFFVFVWSPLPWGWKGIDEYYGIAISVAHGEPFPTMNLVWGYVYFLAFWYRLFGDHPWVPLCAQVLLNASIPLMLYHMVRIELGPRVAPVAALLAGVFSFNTVYAATQAADSVCTTLVVAAMLCLTLARQRQQWRYYALAGLATGVAYQFRPNFVLFPPFVVAVVLLAGPRSVRVLARLAVFVLVFVVAATPWIVRNYRWSGLFVPASTHGGIQLWFGTLQSGDYEHSWIYNPRAAFEFPPLDYSSVDEFPVIVTASAEACAPGATRQVDLVYWTSRDRTPRRLSAVPTAAGGLLRFEVPRLTAPAALYYYVEARARSGERQLSARTPQNGAEQPLMTVISQDHLGDLDVDHYVLDVFDVVRMLRHVYWHEPLPDGAAAADVDGDGTVTERDIRAAIAVLIHDRASASTAGDEVTAIGVSDALITVSLRDGSTVGVPRQWSGRVTDLPLKTVSVGSMAALVVSRSRPFSQLHTARTDTPITPDPCVAIAEIGANRVEYRRLPHEMRRYNALSLDNVGHDPVGFFWGSVHRMLRVFIIEGSSDTRTAYQFGRAALVYAAGRALSLLYLLLGIAGLVIAIARRDRIIHLLMPIVFVPLTICIMLINARYSMTTQPFMFAFVAVALVSAWDEWTGWRDRAARSRPAPAAGPR
jgi:Dolichyl-phosphate-mannose-protein mannosyltransferase